MSHHHGPIPMRLALLPLLACAALAPAGEKGPYQNELKYEIAADGGRVPIPKFKIPEVEPQHRVAFALYTTHRGVLKLTAQCYPLKPGEPRAMTLEIADGDGWKAIAQAPVDARGNNAVFRVTDWDMTKTVKYRVRLGDVAHYAGTIRKDPVDKAQIVVGLFSCNSNGDRRDKPELIANLVHQDPDLLFFAGDQSYAEMDHQWAWLDFGHQFRDIMRDRPTICIPDDHDIGQGNLWGEGGKLATTRGGESGGYFFTNDYVNEVQRAQTSNLPDPFDPTPIQRGITVYYTALNIGGVSFAIVEDRKWKTGPHIASAARTALAQEFPQIGEGVDIPPEKLRTLDVPGAELLGERQLHFLRAWSDDWSGNAQMKVVLSQTVFAGTTHRGKGGKRGGPDLDCNGWPQSGRDRAVEALRRVRATHLCGDQHLGTVIRYGLGAYGEAGHAFCGPATVNFWPRAWDPLAQPDRAIVGVLPLLGDYPDRLGNRITMLAYSNPTDLTGGGKLKPSNPTASGYGLIRYDTTARTATFESWPRFVDVRKPSAKQFAGWPITVSQDEQDGRIADAHLEVTLAGVAQPVVSVIRQSDGELLYTVRSATATFRAPLYGAGPFTVRAWDQDAAKAVERRDVAANAQALRLGE